MMKQLFVLLCGALACTLAGADTFAPTAAPTPGAGKGNPAAFQARKAELANALSQASSCVNGAADRKAMRECLKTLHETLKTEMARPGTE